MMTDTPTRQALARGLLWVVPAVLLVPNVALAFTEAYSVLVVAINILLPLGVYLAVMSLSKRSGLVTLLTLPLMVLAAFQIVLLFLYGKSIIAVDMFLNVVTTNPGEVGELLGNLWQAIATVCVLYLPPLGVAVWLMCGGVMVLRRSLRIPRLAAVVLLTGGAAMLGLCYAIVPGFSIQRHIFPVNVISNMVEAMHRTRAIGGYQATSAHTDYHAVCCRPDSVPELYVIVVGETSRAGNWQLLGYSRSTTPSLTQRDHLVAYPKTLSESNTTHKSVPLMLSPVTAANYADSIYTAKSLISAFSQCGYHTAWITNQKHNRSFIDFFSDEADMQVYIDDSAEATDMDLVEHFRQFVSQSNQPKLMAVIHSYGSHFNYRERYGETFGVFQPDSYSSASRGNREALINAYDNTILHTDAFLDSIMTVAEGSGYRAALMYLADHGEDIYDDERGRFLHASPTPSYYQLHVPLLLWMTADYVQAYPELYEAAEVNSSRNVSSSDCAFHTMLSLAGIVTDRSDPSKALTERAYREPVRVYLNDYNEAVSLADSGMDSVDFKQLEGCGLLP